MALRQEKPRNLDTSVLVTGEQLSLADWVRVSWFFPDTFQQEDVVESSRSLVVLGERHVYKFLHEDGEPAGPLESRWAALAEELADNEALAPDLYFGLRTFRWIDGEPRWLSEAPSLRIDPHRPPSTADEVGLVMRRLPKEGMLSNILAERELAKRELKPIIRLLKRLHMPMTARSRAQKLVAPERALLQQRVSFQDALAHLFREGSRRLEPSLQLVLQEIRALTARYFDRYANDYYARAESGFVVDGHGDLMLEHICLEHAGRNNAFASIIGRQRRGHPQRICDVLNDVARLVLEMESIGRSETARNFSAAYFDRSPDVYDEQLFSYYLLCHAVMQAQQQLGALELESEEENVRQAEQTLAAGYRLATGLNRPFMVAVGGISCLGRSSVAQAVAKMLGVERFTCDKDAVLTRHLPLNEQTTVESILEPSRAALLAQRNVVVEGEFDRRADRIELATLAEHYGVPFLLVRCDLSDEELLTCVLEGCASDVEHLREERRKHRFERSLTWDEELLGRKIEVMVLEPSLDVPQLALDVVRKVRTLSAEPD